MSTAIEEGKRILAQGMPTADSIARAREQLDLALAEQPQSFDVIDLQRRIDMAEAVRTMYDLAPPTIAEVRAQLDAQLKLTREVSTVAQARDLAAMVRASRLLHDLEAAPVKLLDIAQANRTTQKSLLEYLAVHADKVGRDAVAVVLDITREELDEQLAGQADLTFTELRRLALVCGVVIGYVTLPVDRKTIPDEFRKNLGNQLTLTRGQRIARAFQTAQEVAADVELAHLNAAELQAETTRRLEAADRAITTVTEGAGR